MPDSLAHHPAGDTAPSLRNKRGFVCPQCKLTTLEDANESGLCPNDGAYLLRAADVAAAEGDAMLGRVVDDRYTIVAWIGEGSMARVYRAKQHPKGLDHAEAEPPTTPRGRDVALKVLDPQRAPDEETKLRFLREARATSMLTSPHTVKVLDFGECATGELYLAMELLDGETLGERLRRVGQLSIEASIQTAQQALRSLAEAHAKGIIHRDLKPDNLLYAKLPTGELNAPRELVKVFDFGVAKMNGASNDALKTLAGIVLGTPRYMPPEQAQGLQVDARGDLYALGAILYEALTGQPPFLDDDAVVVMAHHIKSKPTPPSALRRDIPRALEAVILCALAKDPAARPESAEAMSAALTDVLVNYQSTALSHVRRVRHLSYLGSFLGTRSRAAWTFGTPTGRILRLATLALAIALAAVFLAAYIR